MTISNPQQCDVLTCCGNDAKEVVRIASDGRVFWMGREVLTDVDFRYAMLELAEVLKANIRPGYGA
jgi:hypothetical protein